MAEESFKAVNGATLMKEVCKRVSEMLSPVFPEIGNNIKKVQFISFKILTLLTYLVFGARG